MDEERAEVKVIFEKEEKLKAYELSNYLYNLKVIYTYLFENREMTERYSTWSFEEIEGQEAEIREDLIESLELPIQEQKNTFFWKNLDSDELEIVEISKENPWICLCEGIVYLIVLSLILSGGELEVSPDGFRVKLNSLGEGLKKLKEVFQE